MSTSFNTAWLIHPKYSGWLEVVTGRPLIAFCKPCHKEISLSNMGKASLDSHLKSKKHLQQCGGKIRADMTSVRSCYTLVIG